MIKVYIMHIILIILLVIGLLYVYSTVCRTGHKDLSSLRGWSYAHRGLHGNGVPENSLAAFAKALENGYGSELDIHLLADGNLAVIHDSQLKRTTGAEGRIEDLTADQLPQYKLEGTNETIPLFSQVLELYAGKAPLIVELKPMDNNVDALCTKVCQLLDGYTGLYCVESFDPRCVYWFRKNRPDLPRGQLTENFFASANSPLSPAIKLMMKALMFNFMTQPDFVAYKYCDRKNIGNFLCRKLWGAQGVSWTLTTMEEYDTAVNEGYIPIFEGFNP